MVGDCCVDGVSAAAAHTDGADAVLLDVGRGDQIIDGETNVGDPDGRIFDKTRRSAACALEAGVESEDDEPFLGKRGPIDVAGGLLLATAYGMGAYDGGVFPLFIEVWRQMDVRRGIPSQVLVGDVSDVL